MSTSTSRHVAMSEPFFANAAGDVLFTIHCKTGVDISGKSKYQHEAEVLYCPGKSFLIDSVVVKKNVWYVGMSEA